ncbi:MAG: hypothetical protein RQ723_12660 [Desulfuromonadales bacterium]|nr:hypothetical protein [Desulfuromonadales bacterium]
MKRIFTGSVMVSLLLGLTGVAFGKGIAGVANTLHNLSSTSVVFSSYASTNLDEICVFCHTPHGGSLSGPLWNHDLPNATSFTHYTSASLSPTLQGLSVSRAVNDESLLCMACHDGSVAVDHLINDPNVLGGTPIMTGFGTDVDIISMFGMAGPRIGESPATPGGTGNLSDDHPISFSYSAVLADPIYSVGGARHLELRPIGNVTDGASVLGWNGEGVRLFGNDNRVECSTCHDPHVDYESGINAPKNYTPFLIRPNDGSQLCLACHNK